MVGAWCQDLSMEQEQDAVSLPQLLASLESLGLLQTRDLLLDEYKAFYGRDAEVSTSEHFDGSPDKASVSLTTG